MKVKDVYTPEARTCRLGSTLAEVASIMWEYDCGFVPVVDHDGRPSGAITDRDIGIALATRDRLASSMMVQEVISRRVIVCTKEDTLESALQVMASEQVRRLPVVDGENRVIGVLSLNDVILGLESRFGVDRPDPLLLELMKTLRAVSFHHLEAMSTS